MFALNEGVLRQMLDRCNFEIPDHGMIFFGICGLLPAEPNRTGFHTEPKVLMANVDYRHMRCTRPIEPIGHSEQHGPRVKTVRREIKALERDGVFDGLTSGEPPSISDSRSLTAPRSYLATQSA